MCVNYEQNDTFAAIFLHSKTANKFSIARTSSIYVINHGLALFFRYVLEHSFSESMFI